MRHVKDLRWWVIALIGGWSSGFMISGGWTANLSVRWRDWSGTRAVAGVLLCSIWLVPMLTRTSSIPFFIMGACLVPIGVAMVHYLAGTIEQVDVG